MNQIVKSAQRVMQIFEFFAETRGRASVNDVCKALGYPQSSTSMLLHSLTKMGYLTYDRYSRTFHPTLRIASLCTWLLDDGVDERGPLRLMEVLAQRTGDTVVLGVQNDIHVLYIQVIQATNPVRIYMKPGSLRPICATAVGRVLLSLKDDAEIPSIVRRVNAERPDSAAPVDLKELMATIAVVRERGYALTVNTATVGAAVIARELPQLADQPSMAIGIAFPSGQVPCVERDYAELLAETISGPRSIKLTT